MADKNTTKTDTLQKSTKKNTPQKYTLDEYVKIHKLPIPLVESYKLYGDLAPKTLDGWTKAFSEFRKRVIKFKQPLKK